MSALPLSDRVLAQREEALAHANEVRIACARLKRDIAAGVVRAADVLEDPPAFTANMKVADLLLVVPRCGRVKANRLLLELRVSPLKTVGMLSERQRRELAGLLAPGRRAA